MCDSVSGINKQCLFRHLSHSAYTAFLCTENVTVLVSSVRSLRFGGSVYPDMTYSPASD